jgi:hypothetical protein
MDNNIVYQSQLDNFGVSLHRAIVNQLIGEIESAIADGRIRSADGKHSVYDFIREILEKKTERQVWKRFVTDFPACVTFCDANTFPEKDKAKASKKTPTTDTGGLIYIAYFANCNFSHNLRASSAAYFAADRQNAPDSLVAQTRENAITQLSNALNNFPNTLNKVWKTSGIVNKSQVKKAILRDFVEERDYVWADGILCVNDSTFHILIVSFRSLAGADIESLPEIIHIKTREYFQYQAAKKMNKRIAQNSEWEQPLLLLIY